jgi:hypothetical protein
MERIRFCIHLSIHHLIKELKLTEKQKPHQNVFKGLGDDWCNLSGSPWPNQRGADRRHVELNSYAKHKYLNINKRIKTKRQ